MPARRDPDGRWRYRKVILAGGRKERISGTPKVNTKVAAEAAERAHIERALSGATTPTEVPTLSKFSEKFMQVYAVKNKPSEQASKQWILDRHLLPAFGKLRLDHITELAILEFRATLVSLDRKPKPLSDKTANNVLTVLTKILRWAKRINVISEAPTPGMLKIHQMEVDFLDFHEYDALRAAAADRVVRAAVIVGGDAGLRRGEIIGLRWADVDMRAHRITVRQSEWDGHVTAPKGGKPRSIPMTNRLHAALKEIRGIGERVFTRASGAKWTKEVMRWALPKAVDAAKLRPIGWHTLRHTFASHLAMKGVPAKQIQEWMGHADLKTTLKYMHLSPRSDEAIHVLETLAPWQAGGKPKSGSR